MPRVLYPFIKDYQEAEFDYMKRILVYGLSPQWGGIEAIIHSLIYKLEDCIQFDILISGNEIDKRHVVHGNNVTILPITAWGASRKKFRHELSEILSVKEYDYVWINASLMCNRDIIAVTKEGSRAEIITHSHGTYFEEENKLKEKILLLLHRINRSYFDKNVKYKFMCSEASGKWFYGEKALKAGQLHLIRNGIDTSRFRFDETVRRNLRAELGLSNEMVLFHAGRLTDVKNQKFLIRLMRELIDMRMNVKLLIAGDGELRGTLEDNIKELHLEEYVNLLGARPDVDRLYQIADIFVLPSFHEGFPVTLTEAQAAGLPCIVSDHVSEETNITGAVKFLPIEETSYSQWIEAISCINIPSPEARRSLGDLVRQLRFDISDVANDFKHILTGTTL